MRVSFERKDEVALPWNILWRKRGQRLSGYEEKKTALKQQIRMYAKNPCMVAFSGGVDSSLLLKLVCEAAEKTAVKVYAVTMQTRLHPVQEIEHAKKVAEEIGAEHVVLTVDELLEAGIEDNPVNRCYLCKKHLFGRMQAKASELAADTILEGTNEDDLHVYRPGLQAVRELGIKSPLADAGFTKAEVRALAAEYDLSVSHRPAVPCLATRFPYGTRLSYEELRRVEQGEEWLKKLGVYNVRLRVHGSVARIEVDLEQFPLVLRSRQEILAYIKGLGYPYVTLDLEGFRSGSMDIEKELV